MSWFWILFSILVVLALLGGCEVPLVETPPIITHRIDNPNPKHTYVRYEGYRKWYSLVDDVQ